MMTQIKKQRKATGAALILVVVVTVLLAVIGVMFLMVSRVSEMETSAIADSRDLNGAVQTVVNRINQVLVADYTDPTDPNLPWLASLEPDAAAGYTWPRITDLWGTIQTNPDSLYAQGWIDDAIAMIVSAHDMPVDIISPSDSMGLAPTLPYGARADADGDGVADSRWVKVPGMSTSRGKDVFAAVRIIDNCAMLNLNTAFGFYFDPADTASWHSKQWHTAANNNANTRSLYNCDGRTLSEVNFTPFLRSYDANHPERIQLFRDRLARIENINNPLNYSYIATPEYFHNQLVMQIENPTLTISGVQKQLFQTFDIGNELEIRNRYLLTSKVISTFEKRDPDEQSDRSLYPPFMTVSGNTYDGVAYETFDLSRGTDVATGLDNWNNDWNAKVKAVPFENIANWTQKIDSYNFDDEDSDNTHDFEYDRRHLCTFYNFDRNLPKGDYLMLEPIFDSITDPVFREKTRSIFIPKGTATTNIETPLAVDASGNSVPYNNVETRRKILHLLYAFRAYYLNQGDTLPVAAKKSAQIIANIIDFSDDDSANPYTDIIPNPKAYGPFYDAAFNIVDNGGTTYPIDYKQQANQDCTFLTQAIIDAMIREVSYALLGGAVVNPADYDFGLGSEVVFGYERQPYISEVYSEWDVDQTSPLLTFAIELVNPYDIPIDLADYTLEIGTVGSYSLAGVPQPQVPAYDLINGLGRLIIYRGSIPAVGAQVKTYPIAGLPVTITRGDDNTIRLLRSNPSDSGTVDLIVDQVLDADYDDHTVSGLAGTIFKDLGVGDNTPSVWSITRDDSQWKFVQAKYNPITQDPTTLGKSKITDTNNNGFQLACPDDGYSPSRWHDLEILSLYGNPEDTGDPNLVITQQIADAATDKWHYDLFPDSNDYTIGLTDYISTMNRPDYGSLPGRININTAPVHVIAAAIPPSLVKLTTANPAGLTAMDYAQAIVDNRPYKTLGQLLNITGVPGQPDFKWYAANSDVGQPSIQDDIEERDWILSNLANKFTVRSDVFTAYILVRLGEDGPQRRMIAIFDRSQVWTPDDRPKLVALHPVPDPR
jgi:hypothetical protein